MKNAMFLKSMVFVGIVASVTFATELLNDNFTSCAATSLKWSLSYPDSMVATCGSGVYTIQNKQKNAAGLAIHAFAAKPGTLTASATITRSNDSIAAGFFICLRTDTMAGYAIQLNAEQSITVYKYSSSITQMYSNFSSYIRGGAASNVVKVSKVGNKLYLFCNDHFIDSITDATGPLANGDFALLVPRNCTATFDDVLMTDQAAAISPQNCIVEGFNDNSTYPWGDLDQNATVSEINNQYLSINTMGASAYDYHYTDIKVDTFVSKTILSFRKGKKSSLYGFFIKGPQITTRVPMAFFAFNGNRQYDAFVDSITLPVIGSTFIYGPPYISGTDTTYFWDTLEVIKTSNSHYYQMFVNGVALDSLSDAKIDFAINGVGVFCDDSLSVYVDSFYIKSGLCSPVTNTSRNTKQLLRRVAFNPSSCEYLVDPLGRKLRVLSLYDRGNVKAPLAPGFYISNNGKSGVVVKKK